MPESRSAEMLRGAVEVPVESLHRLKAIARMVGGDWGMEVELGEPGTGSYFDHANNSIQFDPLHVADPERVKMAEFVAAHEGGHRAITRGPDALGLDRKKAKELYGTLGFAYGLNALEDPADNDWWSKKYEGLEPIVKEIYDKMFAQDAAILGTPEIHKIVARLGSAPRFAHFGSELIRFWHTGEFSKGITNDVRRALERVKKAATEYFHDLPGTHPRESEVVESAQRRFTVFLKRVWPEMERLVREDLADERLRKMVEEGLEEKLPKELREELERKMREALEEMAKEIEEEESDKKDELSQEAETLRELAKKIRQQAQDKSAKEKADAEEAAQELEARAAAREAEIMKISEGKSSSGKPVPLDKLSPELRQALEKAYGKLDVKTRARLEKAARESLEKLEDKMNEDLKGKLDPTAPLSHEELRKQAERKTAQQEKEIKAREEEDRAKYEIKKALEGEKTAYDRAYAAVKPMIDLLADDIDRLFLPKRHPRWSGHFPVGGRLDLRKAMQVEAQPELYTELWERKTIPEKRDYSFTILIDLSGSMGGKTIEETFKGVVLLVEALARVGIDVEILGFQNKLIEFKNFDDQLDDNVRHKMNGMPLEVMNINPGGNNGADWNDDGYAVETAAKRLGERTSREKFLVVFSDGEPAPSDAHAGKRWDLSKVVEKIRAEKNVRPVGVGLGAETEHVRKYYPNSVVIPNVNELSPELAGLLEDILHNPETY